jgi:signal transduction histidine kinase
MSLALRILRDHPDDPELRRTCHDDLQAGLRRIEDTVSRALDFTRGAPPAFQLCSLAQIIETAKSLTATYLRKSHIEWASDLPDDLPALRADPRQLEQLVVNLLMNARKAMPHGGRLTLRAWADADRVHLEVTDSGPGIAPDLIERIFDPFYSGFPEGAGLGLPLSRRIARAHGGELRVHSRPGQGSTFHLEVPLEPPDAVRPPH